ncbi:transcriptional regulator, TetR family [Malonomonas rubra DSM 5091]|uniref:Transcriptional regulator, TetR family n=1 Tax=Malonomonas rubra DSM 5091 TaxID=1122189 RepID=A0A1M6I1R5_MALRU|nr:TetR/AcrR family transcriptional regulator [Malonomonas rubra]SHJ28174.1 transcriptional regulator, TetR family [Malonomonas rubra DSM 5091]
MAQTDTKTRILDAAEQLFARDGYHSTSMRSLTELAQVNLAAVNYHFGSKEGLIKAVFARRLNPLNRIRQEQIEAVLQQAEAEGARPQAKELLRAFIAPILEFRKTESGAQNFLTLIGRSLSEPDETVRSYFIQQVLPIFTLLFRSLQHALPQLPEQLLFSRIQFAMGAMSHMMVNSPQHQKTLPGFPKPLPTEQMADELLEFISAGLEAPC